MIRRLVTIGCVAAAMLTGAAACGGGAPPTYAPVASAWGNPGLSQCYMPLGVPQTAWQAIERQYIAHHYCQPGWIPTYMPQSTYMAYYPYWSSSAYYGYYLPGTYRTSYISYETRFGSQYHSQILTAERTAAYKGSNGKTTTYNQIKSGGGTRAKFGSGTRCSAVRNALLQPQYQARGGTSGGGSRSSGSRSGGGSRSGSGSSSGSGSRSGSGSKTTTKSGC